MVVRRSSGRREHGHDRRPTRLTGRSGPEPARSSPLWISSGPPGGVAGCHTLVWRCGIADSPWPVIHTERAVLADDLADLAPTAGPPRRCAGAGRFTRYSSDTVPSRDHGINAGLGLAPPVHGSHLHQDCAFGSRWLAHVVPDGVVGTTMRSPGRPKMLRISAGSSPVLPNQCGTVVSKAAT